MQVVGDQDGGDVSQVREKKSRGVFFNNVGFSSPRHKNLTRPCLATQRVGPQPRMCCGRTHNKKPSWLLCESCTERAPTPFLCGGGSAA